MKEKKHLLVTIDKLDIKRKTAQTLKMHPKRTKIWWDRTGEYTDPDVDAPNKDVIVEKP